LDAAESDRVIREMRAFSKQVNAAIVDPGFIASVRKKLALRERQDQATAGPTVRLLKVLDRHPDLLNEVRAA